MQGSAIPNHGTIVLQVTFDEVRVQVYQNHPETCYVSKSPRDMLCIKITLRHVMYQNHPETCYVSKSPLDMLCIKITLRHVMYQYYIAHASAI